MHEPIDELVWATAGLPVLLEAMARHCGIPLADVVVRAPSESSDLRLWFENSCGRLDIEVEPVDLWGGRAEIQLRSAAPAVLRAGNGWLGLIEVRGAAAVLLTPAGKLARVRFDDVRSAAVRHIEEPYAHEVDALLETCGITGGRRSRAARALMRERARYDCAGTFYRLRLPPSARFPYQCRQAGVIARLALFAAAHTAEYALWILAWTILGAGALVGHVDPGWLAGWVLVLATLVPVRMLATWSRGVAAIAAGGLLRQRLLVGALRLRPEEVRHEGAGHFLTRSIESQQAESLALSGGLASGLAFIEILLATIVLGMGAGGWPQSLVLAGWSLLAVLCVVRYWRATKRWTDARMPLTHDLVESMSGHRTRLAQQPPEEWHGDEDRQAAEYSLRSAAMDRSAALMHSLIPAGWMAAGIGSLAPAFLSSEASPATLAISVGGVLLASRAFKHLVTGAGHLCAAFVSWRQVAGLFQAAARRENVGLVDTEPGSPETVIEARDLCLERNGRKVLDGISLDLRPGDRVLVEGESGGGKSTLVALLAGLHEGTGGLLLSGGVDRSTLGDKLWRRRVAAVPQYHENHVLSGPFAYNLLMGRNWPPTPRDLEQAYQVSNELGLGPLLERMPGGLMQMVGETGWQLSQGERSRLFMARALLQQAEAVILDESFAALDPENLRLAMECALKRAKTLMVVAHP